MLGEKQPDYRVKRLLDQLGLAYQLDGGDYIVEFQIEGGRSQNVVISSETEEVEGLEIRRVWTMGLRSDSPLHADVANALLVYNANCPIGAWQLVRHKDGKGCSALFVVPVSTNTTATSLRSVMHAVARAGDELEEKFTGEDAF